MRLESGDSPVNPVHRWLRMLVGGAYAYPRLPTLPTVPVLPLLPACLRVGRSAWYLYMC